uniref:Ubiquitin-conjugating enzyme family protein n=1 Tax=Kwoniella bestiolae CBS 10118 TaxID=1296100 RepID=A0A1B9FUD3_9TREE|nr:ubiquitin-conjugating enzyme family protein [Kwoniella bestiolae CBS 10118]OCF22378.1 ubiquitin-conjugating enzyme family protein [Kwoniella bestiolae CBS 10118]
MSDPAFVQLLDMGIPGGRARAALKRTKGDVMSAAERVFAGEFDDTPSDDEGDEPNKASSSKGKGVMVEDSDEDMEDGMAESESESEGMVDGFEDDGEIPEDRLLSDPYAGIFFSKDRVEKIIEPVEDAIYMAVAVSAGSSHNVKILGRGEWMSGCPEGSDFLFQLYSILAEGYMACSGGCGHQFKRKQEDFFVLFPDFLAYTAYLKARVRSSCPQCLQVTCLACGEKVDRNGKQSEEDNLLHCPNLQGVILGVGLHMIEQAFSEGSESKSLSSSASSTNAPPVKKQKTLFGGPTNDAADGSMDENTLSSGYGFMPKFMNKAKGSSKGTGYDGSGKEDQTGQQKAEEAQVRADAKTALLLSQVQVFLPNLNRSGGAKTSDHLVHPTALAHLRRRSAFVNDLLRNDSLLDMSKRSGLYRSLFDWLEIVSNHEALASMLAMPQMRPISTSPCPGDPNSVTVTYEGSSSPRELLENCIIQAQAALKGLQSVDNISRPSDDVMMTEEDLRISKAELARRLREKKEEEKQDANYQLRSFCERIVSSAQTIDKSLVETKGKPFVDRIRDSLPRLPDTGVAVEEGALKGQTDEATIKIYEEWAGRARFQYCDLTEETSTSSDKKTYKHAFNGSIQSLEGMDMPKRSLAIAKELAILTTSLPVAWHSTIFLRVDETRVDVLKAMIIGPEGTPYENGCFIFDIFLPLDYNQRCPNVKFMTTNGGRYRLNPNLYADGKVCLSLLGTWQGPGWISGQSTLLQVLISIQSLILCEEPYINEPGWANDAGTPASKAYSANVRRMVLVDAMANNIKNPPLPFENEIKTHFRLKSKSIRQQIEKWKDLDDGKPVTGDAYSSLGSSNDKSRSFDSASKEMLRLLDQLDSGDSTTSSDVAEASSVGKSREVVREKGGGKLAKALGLKK